MQTKQSNQTENQNEAEQCNITFRIYNLLILLIEIVAVYVKVILYTLESIFQTLFCTPEEIDVSNEIVLITGTAHGIGKELALKYANKGAKVVCWDINEEGNEETVKQIKSKGGKAHAYKCNVLKREEILQVAETVKTEVGDVSILVNNAGIMPCHSFLEHTEEEIRNSFDINVLAHFWLLQAFLPRMIERNHGHIVALSSCAGLFGLKNLVPYCGTKYAVRGIMQALYEELRSDERQLQIKFTTIYPYMVDTGLCKNPRFRFPNLMGLVKIEEAADAIIYAQRTGLEEISIPRYYLWLERISRIVPKKALITVASFLDAGVDSDFKKLN